MKYDVVDGEMAHQEEITVDMVCVSRVRPVVCSRHQCREAKFHSRSRFAGAKVLRLKFNRCSRIDAQRADCVAMFLCNPEYVERGEGNIGKTGGGEKDKLRISRCALYAKLCREMTAEGLRIISYGHFYNLTKDYQILSADNCCCGTCRDFGMYNFNELRDVIKLTAEFIKEIQPCQDEELLDKRCKSLIDRTVADEKFLGTEFFGHLKHQDGNGHHCLTHLLTTYNDTKYCKPCTHERDVSVSLVRARTGLMPTLPL